MIKEKLKSYLRCKLKNLLREEFSTKDDLCVIEKNVENLTVNTQNLCDKINSTEKSIKDFSKTRNQYGEWIHQLFTHVGSLYMFSDDINEKFKDALTAFGTNMAYRLEQRQNNKVVYTCLTGNYDALPLHSYLNFDWDYICFTDSTELLKAKQFGAWQIRPLVFEKLDNTKNSRWHKTHPHVLFPDYDESIWIDANIAIKSSWIFELVEKRKKTDKILIPIHYERDSIFSDIEYCVNILGKETRENADRIIDFLNKENFPADYGLNETNLIFRTHNNSEIIKLMDDWWYFIENYTKRDQFSFSYVLWKHGLSPQDIAIPNIRPLVNSFRIDAIHRQKSAFSEPTDFNFSNYIKTDRDFEFAVETAEQYCAYYRRAGWIALDEEFDVYLKANRQFYTTNKVQRDDVKNNFGLSKANVGFDVKISFYDAAEGELSLYIVNHTKKEIYIKEI